jgi:RNA polymerase sigma-70 factor (ECF subfamily)
LLIESLPPRYRNLITLRYFDELSYEEIAQQLDLPLGTVKAQLFRARYLLGNIINRFNRDDI